MVLHFGSSYREHDPIEPGAFLARAGAAPVLTTVRFEGARTYLGDRVWIVDVAGDRRHLPHVVQTRSDPFGWGYAGSGPAELALNMLVHALGDDADCARCMGTGRSRGGERRCRECRGLRISREVFAAHRPFMWAFVAGLPDDRWSLAVDDVREWWERVERLADSLEAAVR